MIVIGSYAARLNGLDLRATIKDLDLMGSPAGVEAFRAANASFIVEERVIYGHRHRFMTTPESGFQMVEIDVEQPEWVRMLDDLCVGEARVLNITVRYPSLEALYLVKRAHANRPPTYDKTISDMIAMKPRLAPFTPEQMAFLAVCKQESQDRYNQHRQRFALSISNEELSARSDKVRYVNQDDIRLAVAHTPGQPLYRKCRTDQNPAEIDTGLFLALSPEDHLRMVREEFMAAGIERFYLQNKTLPYREVYRRGMRKTIRDLFTGVIQDFCIDNITDLTEPPPFDFLMRFNVAVRQGKVRPAPVTIPPPGEQHRECKRLIDKGELGPARRIAEDMARRGDFGGDPHAYYLLGLIFLKQRDPAMAEKCLRKCLSRDSQNGHAWFQLGVAVQAQGAGKEAIQCFRKAIGLKLDIFPLHAQLGMALQNEGQIKEAAAAYRRALEINPQADPIRQRLSAIGPAAA